MRFQTTGGQFVSAATKAEAAALAAQYGLGEIAGTVPALRKARPAAVRPIGVWCDLTSMWDVEPSRDYGRVAHEWEFGSHDPSAAPAALGRDGGPANLSRDERDAFGRAQEEAV